MKQFISALFVGALCSFGWLPSLSANDCSSAATLTLGSGTTVALDASCEFGPATQDPCGGACNGDAWFEWIPGGTNASQFNVQFDISFNFTGSVNIMLLYSESKELGNPCQWNGTTEGYTRYQHICAQPTSPGFSVDLTAEGLDGSGTFFILVERAGGGSGNVTVTPTFLGNCPAPSNDRCSSPTALTVGNGVDPTVTIGPSIPNWANALCGSTSCATKQRMTADCNGGLFGGPGPATEDHYKRRFSGNCLYRGNVGDIDNVLLPFNNQCDEFLENTVYFSFTVPVTANDYFVHFGSNSQCSQEPNNLAYMIFDGLDCSDAVNSSRIACNKASVTGTIPSADWTYDGGGAGTTFIAGNTYYIVVDGTRQSQCDFCILIARGPANPVLPAEFLSFEGHTQSYGNLLEWKTRMEDGIQSFEVERSADGEVFEGLGSVISEGSLDEEATYSFLDRTPGVGTSFYRIRTTDINGVESSSRTIQLTREQSQAALIDVYPQPATDVLNILLAAPEATTATVQLYDLKGQLIQRMETAIQAGNQELTMGVSDLSQGLYLMNIRLGNRSFQRKIMLR
ncbi:MAG: T9SS type A sorting domain-containing protein [Bacteroidota bacterium]